MAIQSLPQLMSEFKLDRSHSMMCALMQLVTDYLKIHLLCEKIQERKATLVLHLFTYQVRGTRPLLLS